MDKIVQRDHFSMESNGVLLDQKACDNCGYEDSGVYCSNCGSSLYKREITISSLMASIVDIFSDFEDKYFSTVKALFLQPIEFVEAYINGKRDDYYIPFKYFFLNLSLSVFVFNYFDLSNLSIAPSDQELDQLLLLKSDVVFDNIIDNYGQFFSLMFIPFYAVIARILYPRSKWNVAEICTAITFLLGQLMLVELVLNLITAAVHDCYFINKYIIMSLEITIVFIMSFKFFKSDLIAAVWKSVVTLVFLYFSMQLILSFTHDILSLIYID